MYITIVLNFHSAKEIEKVHTKFVKKCLRALYFLVKPHDVLRVGVSSLECVTGNLHCKILAEIGQN